MRKNLASEEVAHSLCYSCAGMRRAIQTVLHTPMNWLVYLLSSGAFFALLVFVPVWTTPGNDFAFQLSITPVWVLVLMGVLSGGNGLVMLMQWHLLRQHAAKYRGRDAVLHGGLVGSAILATIACTACFSSLLSLLGATGVAFLHTHRGLTGFVALGLTLVALYFTARRVNGVCTRCDRIRPH